MDQCNQHSRPCKGCPFARATEPGNLGGSPVHKYVGQARGTFFLPCHNSPGYAPDTSEAGKTPHCAGAAIFRANTGWREHIKEHCSPEAWEKIESMLLLLPASSELVFASFAEFVAHHFETDVATAERWLAAYSPDMLASHHFQQSMANPKARKYRVGGGA